jgi:hypothetical protein
MVDNSQEGSVCPSQLLALLVKSISIPKPLLQWVCWGGAGLRPQGMVLLLASCLAQGTGGHLPEVLKDGGQSHLA